MSDTKSSVDGTHLRAQAAAEDAGVRLDRFLAKSFPEFSRSRLEGLIDAGAVTLDGATVEDANHRVKPGKTYRVAVPAAKPPRPQAQDIPLKIVYEDADLIVIEAHEHDGREPHRVFHRSVADVIASTAPCTVVTLRTPRRVTKAPSSLSARA